MSTYRIATIPGDGIGVDVTTEAVRVLDAVLVARRAAELVEGPPAVAERRH